MDLHDIIVEGYLEDILSANNIKLTRDELFFLDAFYMKEFEDLIKLRGDLSMEEYLCCMMKSINEKFILGMASNHVGLEFAKNEILARGMNHIGGK